MINPFRWLLRHERRRIQAEAEIRQRMMEDDFALRLAHHQAMLAEDFRRQLEEIRQDRPPGWAERQRERNREFLRGAYGEYGQSASDHEIDAMLADYGQQRITPEPEVLERKVARHIRPNGTKQVGLVLPVDVESEPTENL